MSLTISWSLPKFMFIALVTPSSHLILWCPLLLQPSIFPQITDFSNELPVHVRWPKYWSFSLNISPWSVYAGLISLKIDWFDLIAVQGTFRSLFQRSSLKTSIFWHSAFFTVQSHNRTWPLRGGNGKPPQHTCLMNCIKGQKDMAPKDESLRSEDVQHATGEEWRRMANSPRMN